VEGNANEERWVSGDWVGVEMSACTERFVVPAAATKREEAAAPISGEWNRRSSINECRWISRRGTEAKKKKGRTQLRTTLSTTYQL
jgi:hypothetical protein